MSLALIDDLSEATGRLRTAMQSSDLSAIEQAMAEFRQAVAAVQAIGAWRVAPELRERIDALRTELESSRMLACLLGDMTGQMHSAIAASAPDAPQPLYQRHR